MHDERVFNATSLGTLDQLGGGYSHSSNLDGFHDLAATNLTVDVRRAHLRSVSTCSRDDERLIKITSIGRSVN
jgi:hypothetical protein